MQTLLDDAEEFEFILNQREVTEGFQAERYRNQACPLKRVLAI